MEMARRRTLQFSFIAAMWSTVRAQSTLNHDTVGSSHRLGSSYHRQMTAEARAEKIKVLIFDVDGVLTDGQIFVVPKSDSPDGKGIEFKGFAAHDGLGITLGRLGGLRIG